jgi:hypothetical protein
MVFSLILFTGILSGQKGKFNYIDTPVFPEWRMDTPSFRRPYIRVPRDIEIPSLKKQPEFHFNGDSILDDNIIMRKFDDIVIAEELPGWSRYYDNHFIIKPDTNGKLRILKPDNSVKYYLIIKDPIRNTITR